MEFIRTKKSGLTSLWGQRGNYLNKVPGGAVSLQKGPGWCSGARGRHVSKRIQINTSGLGMIVGAECVEEKMKKKNKQTHLFISVSIRDLVMWFTQGIIIMICNNYNNKMANSKDSTRYRAIKEVLFLFLLSVNMESINLELGHTIKNIKTTKTKRS